MRFVGVCTLLAAMIVGTVLLNRQVALVGDDNAEFHPPTRRTADLAIGKTTGLSRSQRLAFQSDDFDLIPDPGPSDWLANHRESGQTFAQYARSRPHVPDRKRNKLYLQPLGKFDIDRAPSVDNLKDFAARFFQMPVQIMPSVALDGLPIQSRRGAEAQTQLLTPDILSWLKTKLPDDGYCILAITMTDLYPDESWNFVFGQASLRDRVGVYSFARYDSPKPELVMRRSCRVMGHETGHMFGIRHCIFFRCLMNGSNHLDESDSQPLHLCPVCLRKMQKAIGFDLQHRYEQLAEFADKTQWPEEQSWLLNRIKKIKNHR